MLTRPFLLAGSCLLWATVASAQTAPVKLWSVSFNPVVSPSPAAGASGQAGKTSAGDSGHWMFEAFGEGGLSRYGGMNGFVVGGGIEVAPPMSGGGGSFGIMSDWALAHSGGVNAYYGSINAQYLAKAGSDDKNHFVLGGGLGILHDYYNTEFKPQLFGGYRHALDAHNCITVEYRLVLTSGAKDNLFLAGIGHRF